MCGFSNREVIKHFRSQKTALNNASRVGSIVEHKLKPKPLSCCNCRDVVQLSLLAASSNI